MNFVVNSFACLLKICEKIIAEVLGTNLEGLETNMALFVGKSLLHANCCDERCMENWWNP